MTTNRGQAVLIYHNNAVKRYVINFPVHGTCNRSLCVMSYFAATMIPSFKVGV